MTRPMTAGFVLVAGVTWIMTVASAVNPRVAADSPKAPNDPIENATQKVKRGRHTFRFDAFGDQAFWGGELKLHRAIEGSKLGGEGPGVSPATALAVGLKIDIDRLPSAVREAIEKNRVTSTILPLPSNC
jgi:hypothetical protein